MKDIDNLEFVNFSRRNQLSVKAFILITTKVGKSREVLSKLREFSDKALAWDTMYEDHQEPAVMEDDTQENYEMREKMDNYLDHAEYENNLDLGEENAEEL